MKTLFIFILSFCTIAISCNNNSQGKGSNTNSSNSDPKSTSSKYGTITCDMNGKQKSFNVQKSFFDITLDVYSKGPKDGVELLDGDRITEGFQFEIKNSGTTTIKDVPGGDKNCIWGYYNSAGVVYTGSDIVVNVTSYDQKHLTGTFSGKLVNVLYDENAKAKNYPQYIQITDGKFDLHK